MTATLKVGDRVTDEPRTWYDGEPVANWPNPQYIGTITRLFQNYGAWVAWVKYDSGRKDLATVAKLEAVSL